MLPVKLALVVLAKVVEEAQELLGQDEAPGMSPLSAADLAGGEAVESFV